MIVVPGIWHAHTTYDYHCIASRVLGVHTWSRSTRRDQGCVLVRENPGSVKREEFVVLVV